MHEIFVNWEKQLLSEPRMEGAKETKFSSKVTKLDKLRWKIREMYWDFTDWLKDRF